MDIITKLITDPEVVLLLTAGAVLVGLLITGKLVPKFILDREVARNEKLETSNKDMTQALRDLTEAQKDSIQSLKDLTAEVRRK